MNNRSVRLLALLLALLMLLPGAAQAKTHTYHLADLSLAFEADASLPEGISELMNMLTVTASTKHYNSTCEADLHLMLNGKKEAAANVHANLFSSSAVISADMLGGEKLFFGYGAACEFAVKMHNHMSLDSFAPMALAIPYSTERIGNKLSPKIQPVLFASQKKRSIRTADVIALAEEIRAAANEGAVSHWLYCVSIANPVVGEKLYQLVDSLPELLAETLTSSKISVSVSKKVQTFKCGKKTLLKLSPTSFALNLPLGSQVIQLDVDQKAQTLVLHWTDGAEVVLDVNAAWTPMPANWAEPAVSGLQVTASGLGTDGKEISLDVRCTVGEDGSLDAEMISGGKRLLHAFGRIEDKGTEKLSISATTAQRDSISFFSLGDASLKSLVSSTKDHVISSIVPILVEMPVSTVAGIMDFLDRGGVFSIAADSYASASSGEYDDEYDYAREESFYEDY